MARNCNKSGINTSNGKRVYVGTTQTVMTQHAGLIGLVDYLRSSNMWDLIVEKVGQHLPRSKRKSKHDSEAMLLQRLIALFVGKEDLNDHDNWKDPILLQVPGVSELASSSTLSRMESQVTDALLHEMNACLLEIFLRKEDPSMIWLDADSTPVPVEGYQEGTEYNGHYRCNCCLPLVIFANGLPIQVTFAGGTADGRNLLEKEIYDITETMQTRFPGTPIVLRGDAGFNRPVILDELEKRGCYYIIGFAPNTAVETMAADEWQPETTKYSIRASDGASIARALGDIEYVPQSWKKSPNKEVRRVIARHQVAPVPKVTDKQRQNPEVTMEADLRLVVTNIPRTGIAHSPLGLADAHAELLYEVHYCQRAHSCEDRFSELKSGMFGARASAHRMRTNWYRMMLSAIAMHVFHYIRKDRFKGAELDGRLWLNIEINRFRQLAANVTAALVECATRLTIRINPRNIYNFEGFEMLTGIKPKPTEPPAEAG